MNMFFFFNQHSYVDWSAWSSDGCFRIFQSVSSVFCTLYIMFSSLFGTWMVSSHFLNCQCHIKNTYINWAEGMNHSHLIWQILEIGCRNSWYMSGWLTGAWEKFFFTLFLCSIHVFIFFFTWNYIHCTWREWKPHVYVTCMKVLAMILIGTDFFFVW